jgi:L-iditol 2-dehydrogenase
MRAVVYKGPGVLKLVDLPSPNLAPGEVRIQVEGCGVCGTDVRIFKGEHSAYDDASGRVPGHEIVGRISECSTEAKLDGLQIGDRVFVAPNVGCGACALCVSGNENLCRQTQGIGITRDGGFAEQVTIPAPAVERGNLIKLESTIDPMSATLIEPLACVLRGQQKVDVRVGDTVLVAGAGPVGLLHIALASASGASLIVCSEPSERRRDAAIRAGATDAVDPLNVDITEYIADLTGGAGIDVVITAAPVAQLQTMAVELAAVGGRVLFFGGLPKTRPTIEINSNTVHYREISIWGTTASTNENCREAATLINRGVLDLAWLITDILPIADYASAINKVQDTSAIKVVLDPGDRS